MRGRDLKYFTIGEESQFFKVASVVSLGKEKPRPREHLSSILTSFKKEKSRKRY
jgi:hypothetical protein